jgi:hypothetical protein
VTTPAPSPSLSLSPSTLKVIPPPTPGAP